MADLKLSRFKTFQCAKCGKSYSNENVPPNDGCGGRIDIILDLESIAQKIGKADLVKRKGGVWKYFEFLPLSSERYELSLGEGNTPLIKSGRLAEEMGLKCLSLKNETVNPSGSFKDRPICVGVSRAAEDGAETVVSASSGNAAAAMSTYAARGGIKAIVFVPEHTPAGKLIHLKALGAKVFRIESRELGVDPTTQLLRDVSSEPGWVPVPSFGPFNCFQFEGTKTLGYEVAEQMNWEAPDWFLFPTGSGGLMAGTMKGFWEFKEMGFIDEVPRPIVVQPTGCAPIVRAFKENEEPNNITPYSSNETCAGGLADPFPWDGDAALKYLRKFNGSVIAVTDDEIKEYLLKLARLEGIFAEPSGVAALPALEILLDQGIIDRKDRIVVPITGSGFKDLDTPSQLMSDAPVIPPDRIHLKEQLINLE